MSPKAAKKSTTVKSAAKRTQTAMSREARATYSEIQQGVKHLEKSIAEIQRGLLKTEQKIAADARVRIRDLRKDVRVQLAVLKSKQREAAVALKGLSVAASDSWVEIKHTADSVLADAKATAGAVIDRFRSAFGG